MIPDLNERGVLISSEVQMGNRITVFLDLQGTLGGDGLGDTSDFKFYPFSVEAIKLLNINGINAIVITNQSHIAKGLLTTEQFEKDIDELRSVLLAYDAHFDGVYCCPHGSYDNCSCKKPLPGLVLQAQNDFDIDFSRSFVVGDMGMSDMVLASNIGAKGILVKTGVGKGSLSDYRETWKEVEPYLIAENVLDAVNHIIATEIHPI
jgi:histidinol-phosphate phosphatase family protein